MAQLRAAVDLTRPGLSCAFAFSALAGFIFLRRALTPDAWPLFAGVLMLAGGSSALNQLQEARFDALMERTRARPVPSRRLLRRQALAAAVCLGIAGVALLLFGTTVWAAALGMLTALWYNGVYTPLKRLTRWAVLAGALTGALSPLIGIAAAHGRLTSAAIVIAAFVYLWQIPHFLLVLLKSGGEYERAGFPSLSSSMSGACFRATIFMAAAASSACALAFPLFGIVSGAAGLAALLCVNAGFLGVFAKSVLTRGGIEFGPAARVMHLFQWAVLGLVIAAALMRAGRGA